MCGATGPIHPNWVILGVAKKSQNTNLYLERERDLILKVLGNENEQKESVALISTLS